MNVEKVVTAKCEAVLGPIRCESRATVRMNFSVQHILAAAKFSRHVNIIEQENHDKPFGAFYEDILAYSSACVSSSVSSIEAYANELFVDVEKNFPDLKPDVMHKLWGFFEQRPLLDKFDFALLLRGKTELDKGVSPYQDIAALIALRNALTHFKPEWENDQAVHAKVSARLSGRFKPSQYFQGHEPIFPRRWACHSCTKWAVDSCITFVEAFDSQANLTPHLKPFLDRIHPC